jgi:hypothetical protein
MSRTKRTQEVRCSRDRRGGDDRHGRKYGETALDIAKFAAKDPFANEFECIALLEGR